MLRMDKIHVIRHKVLLEGKSVRSVAKEMGVSRNTVAKYLKNPEPTRRVAHKQKRAPVTDMVAPRIEEILSEWSERTTPKQRITGTRIHRQLLEEGYEVGITTDCGSCPSRELCTQSDAKYPRRRLTIRPKEQYEALQAAREREGTVEFKAQYTKRAGIEGTISRAVRTCEVRRSRYMGLTRTHLHHLLSATSLSFLRVGEWLMGITKPKTRRSPFARLMAGAVAT